MSHMLDTATVADLFEGKKDKHGQIYFGHLSRVASMVRHLGEDAVQVALFHDVIEDTDWGSKELHDYGMKIQNIARVALLTNWGLPYDKYIETIVNCTDDMVVHIKMADLSDNLSRCSSLPEPDRSRIMKKYLKAYNILAKRIGAQL
jgi:(p)ppGpp synthase/HD superfamily hydrolase